MYICIGVYMNTHAKAVKNAEKRLFKAFFSEKECLKRLKIADLSFYFEFQVVVAVVGFKWHWRETVEKADLRSGNAFKSLPQRNALISLFNDVGSDFSILHRS